MFNCNLVTWLTSLYRGQVVLGRRVVGEHVHVHGGRAVEEGAPIGEKENGII